MKYLNLLKKQFNNRIDFIQRRKGIYQLYLPIYHEDGDMLDIFLDVLNGGNGKIKISDHGMSLMRLSYDLDLDTPSRKKIFEKILAENQVSNDEGNLYIETEPDQLFNAIMQFSQAIAKVCNLQHHKREVIRSLFYEDLREYVMSGLSEYNPTYKFYPIEGRDELEVDYFFDIKPRPVYMFGVRGKDKSRLAALFCSQFILNNLKFRSLMVHEDFSSLSVRDQKLITNIADKQFYTFEDFHKDGYNYLKRESA